MRVYHPVPIVNLVAADLDNGSELAKALLAIAWRITGNIHDAEDARQEFYLKLLKGGGETYRFDIDDAMGVKDRRVTSWAYRVVGNAATDLLRKRYREARKVKPLISLSEDGTTVDELAGGDVKCNPLEVLMDRDLIREAYSILNRGNYLELSLSYYGSSYQDIAVLCNCPLGTVKSRIHAQKKIFQRELREAIPGVFG